jgi:ribosome-associated protein
MKTPTLKILDLIAQTIFDKKGFNILAIDVRGISTMTDFFIIAEGNVERHVRALGMAMIDQLNEVGFSVLHAEGNKIGDWIVLDYGEFVIHLFHPDLREKYSLEELWKEGKIVDLSIIVKKGENQVLK